METMIDEVTTLRNNEITEDNTEASNHYSSIAKVIVSHTAIKELDRFGELICQKPMNEDELRMFFGTVWAFFKDVPSGIIHLAGNITDNFINSDPWEASSLAAYVLYASVDEYGLQQFQTSMLSTHHQMFRDLIRHFDISDEELFSKKYVLPAGTSMGDNTYRYYRSSKIGESLGFHLASEMTSSREFQYFLEGFQKYPMEYNLSDKDDPILTFFAIHCDVEPMHVSTGRDVLIKCFLKDPQIANDAMTGALSFMDGFENMFKSINTSLLERR